MLKQRVLGGALFFYSGNDLLHLPRQNRLIIERWRTGAAGRNSANSAFMEKYFRNFRKAFNVLPDTVVLYLGEHKGSVAPN
ncbi:hypothetical protein [Duganella caerulea]|uniref:hypothetical protein n=1 Tax=Duganella caerulea TaxID=2885762 RepID=UPI0040378ECD